MARKKKRPNNSAKGARYERTMCVRLSLWVTNLLRQDVFWRSAMSGGRATRFRKAHKGDLAAHAGDIVCNRPEGMHFRDIFCADMKFRNDFNIERVAYGHDGHITGDWVKLCEEAKNHKLIPILFCKRTRRGEFVVTTAEGLKILQSGGSLEPRMHLPQIDAWIVSQREMLLLDYDLIRVAFPKRPPRPRVRPKKRVRPR